MLSGLVSAYLLPSLSICKCHGVPIGYIRKKRYHSFEMLKMILYISAVSFLTVTEIYKLIFFNFEIRRLEDRD